MIREPFIAMKYFHSTEAMEYFLIFLRFSISCLQLPKDSHWLIFPIFLPALASTNVSVLIILEANSPVQTSELF